MLSLLFPWEVPLTATAHETGNAYKKIEDPVVQSLEIRRTTQKEEETWRNEKEKLTLYYDQLIDRKNVLIAQNEKLVKEIAEIEHRIDNREKELEKIEHIQKEIRPLIDHLFGQLHRLITTGLPFLTDERSRRLDRLHELQNDPEVTLSELFRRIMEALLIEAEYGNTIEVYQKMLDLSDKQVLANIFRLGGLALFFQTPDKQICGFFNTASGSWQILPSSYNEDIGKAIEIGKKRHPAEFVNLPLGRIQVP